MSRLTWDSDTCACGGEHQPHECKVLDFAPCALDLDGFKVFAGVDVMREPAHAPLRDVDIVLFDTSDGCVKADFLMSPDDLRDFGRTLIALADRFEDADKTQRPVPTYAQAKARRYFSF